MQLLNKVVLDQEDLVAFNITSKEKTKVYFDVTTYDLRKNTGIERVVKELLTKLESCLPKSYIVIPVIVDIENKTLCRARRVGYDWFAGEKLELTKNSFFLGACLNPFLTKVMKEVRESGCKSLIILYDLVYIKYPETMVSRNFSNILIKWLRCISDYSTGVVAISKTVRDEYLQWLEQEKVNNRPLVDYFYLGCDFLNSNGKEINLPTEINLKRLNLLSVSTIEPRKDYPLLINSFRSALKKGFKANLFIVGRKGWGSDLDYLLKNTPFIYWFENSSDSILSGLYRVADVFVSSSIYEGFGLTLLEASHYKLPLLLRNIPVYKELAENQALYFTNENDLTEIFLRIGSEDCYLKSNELQLTSWLEATMKIADLIIKIEGDTN